MESRQLLKDHGLRITENRQAILDVFIDKKMALSQNDIEQIFNEIDRITLYRTLKTFEKKGLIHKAIDGTDTPKYALCEENCTELNHRHEHVHFHCKKCNNTYCVDEIDIPSLKIPEGFTLDHTHVVMNGLCNNC